MFIYTIENGYCCIKGYKGDMPARLEIPASIKGAEVCSIGDYAFERAAMEQVVLPSTIQMIGHKAFKDCPNLKKINYDKVPHVRPDAFEGTLIAKV